MEKLRVFTAFSGYDSQLMGLRRAGVDCELVGWSEIDKAAIKAHNAVFPEYAERNYGNICHIDWASVPDFDLFTYSSPCQDFSIAGLQRGGEEGSGTRSSLLWECRKAIEAKRPKYLLLENVAALVSQKFAPTFSKWLGVLSGLGYTNFFDVLNAKDYGVPQNRERVFVVSIRDCETAYYFPKPIPLSKRLKDVLETNVPERYYLSEKRIAGMTNSTEKEAARGNGFAFKTHTLDDDYAYTICAAAGSRKADNYIVDEPSILRRQRTEEQKAKRRETGDVGIGFGEGCYYAPAADGVSNTLTTVQKDNLLAEPKILGYTRKPADGGGGTLPCGTLTMCATASAPPDETPTRYMSPSLPPPRRTQSVRNARASQPGRLQPKGRGRQRHSQHDNHSAKGQHDNRTE